MSWAMLPGSVISRKVTYTWPQNPRSMCWISVSVKIEKKIRRITEMKMKMARKMRVKLMKIDTPEARAALGSTATAN